MYSQNGWSVRYTLTDEHWSEGTGTAAEHDGEDFFIPLSSGKGFKGRLRLVVRHVMVELPA